MKLIPEETSTRRIWLFILLAAFSFLAFKALSKVFWTLFLAATFAYVLHPLKEKIQRESLTDKQSAALVTVLGFFLTVTLLAPIFFVLFQRRQIVLDFISSLPDQITVELFELSLSYPTAELESLARNWITNTAIKLAESLPSLSLKAFLFIFLLYAILKHPRSIKSKLLAVFPDSAEEIMMGYNQRVRQTLVGIFAVQTLTAVITFLLAMPVFYLLGYSAFISLALLCGILQFIPIVGPALVIIALAGLEILAGATVKAVMILVFGLVIIGFLPDAYLRPRLAGKTTGLPASLYFIGFAGGALTLGAVGVIAGPLSIALLLETTELLVQKEN